jgi:hypothetical protein
LRLYLKPPPQLTEFTHSSGKDGPNLKDRRKAMSNKFILFKLKHMQKIQSEGV